MKIQLRITLTVTTLAACMSFISVPAGSITGRVHTDSIVKKYAPVVTCYFLQDLDWLLEQREPVQLQLGKTKQGRTIGAYYYPGSSDERALIIGGMHGSELSSIEVSKMLVRSLAGGNRPYYSVIIIPSLFPDNAAMAIDHPAQIGDAFNIGRYTHNGAVDPNRQMPSPGKPFNSNDPRDHAGRIIEKENQVMLQLIDIFRPSRIANLHAIRKTNYGGVYADPRTDHQGLALGYASDSNLAIAIARSICNNGGNVAGNHLATKPTALYYKDPVPVPPGCRQKRNMTGSILNAHRGSGVSMGTWGTTAIRLGSDTSWNRAAMRVLTIEFPGAKRPEDHASISEKKYWQMQVNIFAGAIEEIFLGRHFTES